MEEIVNEVQMAGPSEWNLQLQKMKRELLKEFEVSLTSRIDQLVLEETYRHGSECCNRNGANKLPATASPNSKSDQLPAKVFVTRNSVLTNLWNIPDFAAAYNICTALFVLLNINCLMLYLVDSKRFNDDFEFLFWVGGKVNYWFSIWVFMNMLALMVFYPAYRCWAYTRMPLPKFGIHDGFFLLLLLGYVVAFTYFPVKFLLAANLSPVTSFFVLVEQVRLMMKMYAFVRENVPKTIKYKLHQGGGKEFTPCPDFQKFLYFLFAPTLIYRDTYPRTSTTRWNYVAWNFLQVVATILVTFIAFRRFVVELFNNVGKETFTPASFIMILTGAIMVGSMSMFVGFYGLLHCWLNAWSEILRFGDRVFYKDWWNCTSFAKYYRTWNTVVHDWLFAYVYTDVYQVFGKRQTPAMIITFLFSAIVHEFILTLTMGFFFPVLFFLFAVFGIGVTFATRKRTSPIWNIFLWFSLFLGWGLMIVLYSIEFYARKNCPFEHVSSLELFIPRSFRCKVIHIPFLEI